MWLWVPADVVRACRLEAGPGKTGRIRASHWCPSDHCGVRSRCLNRPIFARPLGWRASVKENHDAEIRGSALTQLAVLTRSGATVSSARALLAAHGDTFRLRLGAKTMVRRSSDSVRGSTLAT